ncbi:MAG: response regulator [Candidatus Saganbacteria bacterium]|nr:response regulator [Candidatus Saganbacteria bacterium]
MDMPKILIVDDEKDILELFSRVLENYYVKTAENDKEAEELLSKEVFDLIFLDIIIPNVDPLEFFKLIKKISPKSKIIVITGFAVENVINQMMKLGAAGVMHKPFNHINDIKLAVKRVLNE